MTSPTEPTVPHVQGPYVPQQAAPVSPPGYPQSPYPYQPHYVPVVGPPTSGLAVASMVVGILGAAGGWCLAGIPCLIAILLGHLALRETRNQQKSGHGMAVAGLVLGYVFAVPWVMLAITGALGSIGSA